MHTSISDTSRIRQVTAAVLGNALEWYDFAIYGFMAAIIARQFFPAENEAASLMMALATIGVAFFMRPVGGVLLGIYSDRRGRKAAMQLIIVLMTVSIMMIAFAPNYAAIGIGAPLLIVVARMLQGFATGGEYASATAFLVESAPFEKQGLYGSWQLSGQCLALFSGAGVVALVTYALSPEELDSWGWRVPFILGLLIAPVGMWMRKNMHEPEAFVVARKSRGQEGLGTLLSSYRRNLLVTMGICCSGTAATYVVMVHMPTFAHRQLGLALDEVLLVQMFALGWMAVLVPFAGALSDRLGRRSLLMLSTLFLVVVIYPLYVWVTTAPSLERLMIMQFVLCSAIAVSYGPSPTAMAEQFPVAIRSTGVAVSYNGAVMVFGGFAPLTVTWLIERLGTPVAPAFYVLFACVIGLAGIYYMHDEPIARRRQAASAPPVEI